VPLVGSGQPIKIKRAGESPRCLGALGTLPLFPFATCGSPGTCAVPFGRQGKQGHSDSRRQRSLGALWRSCTGAVHRRRGAARLVCCSRYIVGENGNYQAAHAQDRLSVPSQFVDRPALRALLAGIGTHSRPSHTSAWSL